MRQTGGTQWSHRSVCFPLMPSALFTRPAGWMLKALQQQILDETLTVDRPREEQDILRRAEAEQAADGRSHL